MAFEKKSYKKTYKTEKAPVYKPKRGKLAPLMKEDKEKASIHELSFDFACRTTRLYQYLTEDAEYKEFSHSKQLYRSGSSIGAKVSETSIVKTMRTKLGYDKEKIK